MMPRVPSAIKHYGNGVPSRFLIVVKPFQKSGPSQVKGQIFWSGEMPRLTDEVIPIDDYVGGHAFNSARGTRFDPARDRSKIQCERGLCAPFSEHLRAF